MALVEHDDVGTGSTLDHLEPVLSYARKSNLPCRTFAKKIADEIPDNLKFWERREEYNPLILEGVENQANMIWLIVSRLIFDKGGSIEAHLFKL